MDKKGHQLFIDGDKYTWEQDTITGAQLRTIAPRQYQHLFSMLGRGKKGGAYSLKEWGMNRAILSPHHLVKNAYAGYLLAERQELTRLPLEKFKWDPSIVCPS